MKFVVATYGTEGDTRPLAALCRALMDAGHEARLLADEATLGSARALGVPVTALAGDIRGALQQAHGISSVIAGKPSLRKTASALGRIANRHADAWLRDIVAAGEGCDALIVSALASFVGLSAAEYLGVKAIGASLIPLSPTAAFASPFLPPGRVPGAFNRASHRFVNAMLWRAFRKKTNTARASVCGLPPRQAVWDGHAMLYGISPGLLPRPPDWPANACVTGQWLAPARAWSPPPALAGFLEGGDAPIYVGFGSMMGFDRVQVLDAVVGAVAGRRALFQPGWSGIDTSALPGNFHVIGDTPHDWLFPRASMVIHHGGSGTTHSAARAGVPSVVLPFAADQFFWAERLRLAGVAGRAISGRHLRADTLAAGIEFARGEPVRARARELGAAMRAEDGTARAVDAIMRVMAG